MHPLALFLSTEIYVLYSFSKVLGDRSTKIKKIADIVVYGYKQQLYGAIVKVLNSMKM